MHLMRSVGIPVLPSMVRTMYFYAVAKGRKVGIYDSWAKCEEQVKGYRGARYKKFPSRTLAEAFINDSSSPRPRSLARQTKSNGESTIEEFWPEGFVDSSGCSPGLRDEDLVTVLTDIESKHPRSRKRSRSREKFLNPKKPRMGYGEISVHTETINEKPFSVDVDGFVVVYTDGSCFNNGQVGACAGYGVYFGNDHVLNAGKPVTGRVTNNVGEIQAAIHAVKVAQREGIRKLCIMTDSKFLIQAMTLWLENWKRNNWCLKNGDGVKNVVDFMELDALLQREPKIQMKWCYVKAHAGHKGNEMADKLARDGSALYRMHRNNK